MYTAWNLWYIENFYEREIYETMNFYCFKLRA